MLGRACEFSTTAPLPTFHAKSVIGWTAISGYMDWARGSDCLASRFSWSYPFQFPLWGCNSETLSAIEVQANDDPIKHPGTYIWGRPSQLVRVTNSIRRCCEDSVRTCVLEEATLRSSCKEERVWVATTWSDMCVKCNVKFKLKRADNLGMFSSTVIKNNKLRRLIQISEFI
jgi:hypothetical protein